MKKIFTLMSAALLTLSASAEVIYSWESEGPDAVTQTGGTATAYGDETRVNYPNKCNDVTYYTICLTGKKETYPSSAYVNITLDKALAEGDIISVTAFRNKNELGKNVSIEFLFDGKTDNSISSTEQFANINPDGEADPAPSTQTFTVPASADGCTSFDMTRGSAGTNLFITKIEITREGTGEETAEALMHWDFTKWSEETVANLIAGPNWSDDEKGDGKTVDNNCFWQVSCTEGLSPEKYLMANDVVIEELKGLVYTNDTKSRSLAIAVNYPSTSLGEYHGASYLWLGASNIKYFIIPEVPAGATIKMGVESHKSTDARGVKLTIGDTNLTAPDGTDVAAPTTYVEQEWLVPADAAESNDVQITNTNGCHLYYITVTAGAGSTGVHTAAIDENAPVEYYNLQGVRVAEPANGLYIKRQGNKAMKVLVK